MSKLHWRQSAVPASTLPPSEAEDGGPHPSPARKCLRARNRYKLRRLVVLESAIKRVGLLFEAEYTCHSTDSPLVHDHT